MSQAEAKFMTEKRKQALRAAVAAVALGGLAHHGSAATIAWDNGGADNNWNNALNWAGDVLPTSADKIQLTSSIATNTTVSLGASQTISELRIESSANVGNFIIGSAADIAAGYTLTLTNVYRGDNNSNNQTIAANVKLSSDSTWNIINGFNGIVSVTGAVGSDAAVTFTKEGSNTLTMNGANTFTGGVRIFGGTLSLGGTNAYTGNTTVSGGGLTLNFNAGAGSPTTNILNSATGLIMGGFRGGATLTVNGKNLANVVNSQTFAGTTIAAGSSSMAIVNGISTGKTAVNLGAITRTVAGTVNFAQPTVNTAISAQNGYTTSTGNTNGILGAWATVGNADWAANNGTNIVAYSGYSPLVSDGIVDGAGTNVRVLNSGSTADITQGPGTTNINTLLFNDTASRTVAVGTGNTLRLGAVGGILKLGTGALTIGASGTAGTLTAGGADNTAGELILNTGTTLTVNSEVANNGTGAVTLTKAGSSVAVLNTVASYTGGTYVTNGTLAFNGSNASTVSSMGTATTSLTVSSSAGMAVGQSVIGSNIRTGTRITGINGNTITLSAATTNTSTASNVAVTAYVGAAAGDRLNNTGDIFITGGTLEFGNSSATQATSGQVVMYGGAMNNGTLTKSGSNFDIRAGTIGTALAGNVGLNKTTLGILTFANASANTYTGDTTISEGSVTGSFHNVVSVNGNLVVGSAGGGNAASFSAPGNNVSWNANKNLTIYSNGSVNLGGGAYTFAGTVNILGGSFNLSQIFGSGTWNMQGGSLSGTFYGNSRTINHTGDVTSVVNAGAGGIALTFNVADGAQDVDLIFNGGIVNPTGGTVGMTKTGAGLMTSTASQAYSGVTALNNGTLRVTTMANGTVNSPIGAASVAASNLVFGGGTLQYTGTGSSTDRLFTISTGTAGTIDASGSGALNFTSTGSVAYGTTNQARTLALTGTSTADNTLSLAIGNNGSSAVGLNKTGAGKWILAGTSNYTGATSVTGGTLLVTGSLGATAVTVNGTNAVFGGTGSVGTVTVKSGATLAPGNGANGKFSTGTLTLEGTLAAKLNKTSSAVLNAGATNASANAGVDYDQVATGNTSSVNISGGVLALTTNSNLAVGDVFYLLDNQGSSAINGSFASATINGYATTGGYTDGSAFSSSLVTLQISYDTVTGGAFNSGSGNDIALLVTAAPEPASLGLVGVAGMALLARRRRSVRSDD
jgi:fibronectin-binding autotransporter adhesin